MHAKEEVPIFCQPAACVADGQETGVMTTGNNCLALPHAMSRLYSK